MKLRIRYFAMFGEAAGTDPGEMEFHGRRVADLRKVITEKYPEFERRGMLVAVNEKYADDSLELVDGDEVAVFPPVSGG